MCFEHSGDTQFFLSHTDESCKDKTGVCVWIYENKLLASPPTLPMRRGTRKPLHTTPFSKVTFLMRYSVDCQCCVGRSILFFDLVDPYPFLFWSNYTLSMQSHWRSTLCVTVGFTQVQRKFHLLKVTKFSEKFSSKSSWSHWILMSQKNTMWYVLQIN